MGLSPAPTTAKRRHDPFRPRGDRFSLEIFGSLDWGTVSAFVAALALNVHSTAPFASSIRTAFFSLILRLPPSMLGLQVAPHLFGPRPSFAVFHSIPLDLSAVSLSK